VRFTPSQLARDIGGSARAWQRECERGEIGAVRTSAGWIVSWQQLVRYVAIRQNVVPAFASRSSRRDEWKKQATV